MKNSEFNLIMLSMFLFGLLVWKWDESDMYKKEFYNQLIIHNEHLKKDSIFFSEQAVKMKTINSTIDSILIELK